MTNDDTAAHTPAPAFAWSERFALGHGTIDANHREFVDLVNAMIVGPDDSLEGALDRFRAHAERHFGEEDAWMVEDDMPNRQCHLDEHQAVLASVREVQALEPGERKNAIIRDIAEHLARWFPGHAEQMDLAVAKSLVKKQLGGVPVMIRRNPLSG